MNYWLLYTGKWNDDGVWDDNAQWNDGKNDMLTNYQRPSCDLGLVPGASLIMANPAIQAAAAAVLAYPA